MRLSMTERAVSRPGLPAAGLFLAVFLAYAAGALVSAVAVG